MLTIATLGCKPPKECSHAYVESISHVERLTPVIARAAAVFTTQELGEVQR